MSLKDKIKKVNKKPKKETPTVEIKIKEEPKKKGRVGRPTDKKEGVPYSAINVHLPNKTILRLQIAVPKLRSKGVLKTQNALVDIAIKEYLDRNKDLLEIE